VLSTLYAGVVSAVIYRDLGFKRLHNAVVDAGLATGVVLLVIMASAAIGWLLTFDQMPQGVVHWVQQNVHASGCVILLMNLMMLFLGMFIDLPAAVLLLTPVFVPLANAIGMDLTQLGIMMVVNLAIGLYTPPVGTTLFITSALAKVKVGQTVRELGPVLPRRLSRAGARLLRAGFDPQVPRSPSMTPPPTLAELSQSAPTASAATPCAWAKCRARATSARPSATPTCWRWPTATPCACGRTNPNGRGATASCSRTATTRSRTMRR
jgi:hypothetical protein